MAVDYSVLTAGQEISRKSYTMDERTVASYIDAVADESSDKIADGGNSIVPAMAIAAISLRGVIQDLEIPGGTLHAGQELEFTGIVPIGESLDCKATLLQNSIRKGWRFLVVRLEVADSSGRQVMNGKSTITLPP